GKWIGHGRQEAEGDAEDLWDRVRAPRVLRRRSDREPDEDQADPKEEGGREGDEDSECGGRPRQKEEDQRHEDPGQCDDKTAHGQSDRVGGGRHFRSDQHVLEAEPLLVEVYALRGEEARERKREDDRPDQGLHGGLLVREHEDEDNRQEREEADHDEEHRVPEERQGVEQSDVKGLTYPRLQSIPPRS